MVLGLRQFTERVGDGAGVPFLDADNGEELMHELPGVAVVLGNRAPESPGTLYISTKYSLSLSLSIYIYIYMHLCVCVCVVRIMFGC
jgi:nucleotide-sensitive chloride channel 1A